MRCHQRKEGSRFLRLMMKKKRKKRQEEVAFLRVTNLEEIFLVMVIDLTLSKETMMAMTMEMRKMTVRQRRFK